MAARARGDRAPQAGHRRPAAARPAAARAGVLAGHRRRGARHDRRPRGRRVPDRPGGCGFNKPPTLAVTTPATTATLDRRPGHRLATCLRGHDDPRRHGHDRGLRHADAGRRPIRPGDWSAAGRPPARQEPVQGLSDRPGHRQGVRGDGPDRHHGAVRRHRGADADRRPAGRRLDRRERRDPRPGHDDERDERRRSRRSYDGPLAGAPAASARRNAAARADPGRRSRSPRTGRSTRRSSSRPATGRSSSPRPARRTRPPSLTRHVAVAYKGVEPRRRDQGRPGLDQGLGRRQARSELGRRDRQEGQGHHVHGRTTSVEVRTGSCGATYFTLNGQPLGALGKRGIPRRGCSSRRRPRRRRTHS